MSLLAPRVPACRWLSCVYPPLSGSPVGWCGGQLVHEEASGLLVIGSGSRLPLFTSAPSSTLLQSPTLVDIDNDGDVDVRVPTNRVPPTEPLHINQWEVFVSGAEPGGWGPYFTLHETACAVLASMALLCATLLACVSDPWLFALMCVEVVPATAPALLTVCVCECDHPCAVLT